MLTDCVRLLFKQFSIGNMRNQWSRIEGHNSIAHHKTRPNITFTEPISKKCAYACWVRSSRLSLPSEFIVNGKKKNMKINIENNSINCTQVYELVEQNVKEENENMLFISLMWSMYIVHCTCTIHMFFVVTLLKIEPSYSIQWTS